MPKPRYSQSQHLRFRIHELFETKGSKKSFEEFYAEKMEEIIKGVQDEIFYSRMGADVDTGISQVEKVFGAKREQRFPLE